MEGCQEVATHVSGELAKIGPYRLVSEGKDLPVFAFGVADGVKNYTVFEVSDRMRQHGWLIPAYTFPKNREDLSVLRVVIRSGMNLDMADKLLEQFDTETKFLDALTEPMPGAKRQAFRH
jgi:glutamate decarboxylase